MDSFHHGAMILTQDLGKRFGDLWAVRGVTLDIPKGEIFGLVGPDGSGKTTIIRMLAGVLEPSEGEARVAGYDLKEEAERVKERIGYMSQRFGLYEDLTVMENLHFYADLYEIPKRERGGRISRLLEFSQLGPFRKRRAEALSGGMKQKLGLACALIHTPEVLLLDEPTCGVDPLSRRDFWRILYELLRERVTILLSTAYLDEAERCHRVGLLHRGRLIALGSPDRIKEGMPGRAFQIRVANPKGALKPIEEMDGVIQAHLFGDRIHLVLQEGEGVLEGVLNLLQGKGHEAWEVRPVLPTLEDLFVSRIRQEDKEDAIGHSPQ